jgi:putative ATPase
VLDRRSRVRFVGGRGGRTLLFVDEIHRFNKAQQDAFLPHVERGDLVLVGATTENPSFAVNGALLSRCRVVRCAPSTRPTWSRCSRARSRRRPRPGRARGATPEAPVLERLAALVRGDARRALGALEAAAGLAAKAGRVTTDAVVERRR